jgi:hypothetical protein
MKLTSLTSFSRRHAAAALVAGACALVGAGAASASAQSGESVAQMTPPPTSNGVSATLEQCVTSLVQGERAATFTGEMTAIPGAARMAIRIDVEERAPGETEFHFVSASGLGVWRWADPKVKVYKYLKQVTNLSAPASYRGLVRFRWTSAKGHVVKRAERLTSRCPQPASTTQPQTTGEGTSTNPTSMTQATPSA